jgi:hypothetical protein
MTLTDEQKQAFYNDGYVVLPGLVPAEQVRHAKRAVNRSLGRGIDPHRITEYESQSFCPELRNDPVIWDLLRANESRAVVESLVGPGSIDPDDLHPQLAIRFPSAGDEPYDVRPHLDGMYTPTNGLEPGDIWSHTLLVGVFLSDIREENAGNFTAWPGSHHTYERHFRENGPQSLLEGMPTIDIGSPRQVMARTGDVLLAHYQLGHAAGCHIGADVRYTVFFRVTHPRHDTQKWEAMTDIWLEYPGMETVLRADP